MIGILLKSRDLLGFLEVLKGKEKRNDITDRSYLHSSFDYFQKNKQALLLAEWNWIRDCLDLLKNSKKIDPI